MGLIYEIEYKGKKIELTNELLKEIELIISSSKKLNDEEILICEEV